MAQSRRGHDSAAAAIGRLIGATLALPVSAAVFLIGAATGASLATAVLRALGGGVAIFLVSGLCARLFLGSIAGDLRRRRTSERVGAPRT
jgi:hypothetical protein